MLSIVLSMYAYDPNSQLPGPTELMYCDSNTTYEEVEIFLRRAFNNNSKDTNAIYTLLNTQELNYETSNRLETNYQKLAATRLNENFILVFVCGTERQSESIISSLFLNYKISPVSLDNADLEHYLKASLINESSALGQYEQFSVRSLISAR